jgi:hypothetical protein
LGVSSGDTCGDTCERSTIMGPSTSGLVMCFIPLGLVIIGFVVAAYFTNKQATAAYLRVDPASVKDE